MSHMETITMEGFFEEEMLELKIQPQLRMSYIGRTKA